MSTSVDRIERKVLIKSTRARVWQAVSNAAEFGDWFGVDFKGQEFVAGKTVRGKITYPGYEHLTMEVVIDKIVPERLLSWHWHPAAIDAAVDYSSEPMTHVTFELHQAEGGVIVTVVESGLDKIPLERRATVFRLNSSGWDEQMENIKKHVDET